VTDTTATPIQHTKPRDRAATEQRIVAAVGEVLSRDGFAGIGVNAIAKQAGVDKVLIYRYFGGLPELLRAYGQSGAFWPSVQGLLGDNPQAVLSLPAAQRYARFFEHFIDELRARPLTLEILAQEVIARNELTAILEEERERWGQEASQVLGGEAMARTPGAPGITLMLIAGVQYMLVRARKIRTFGGIDLRSDEGWAALKASIVEQAHRMFP
jgi:AcrR family transcriptional regulator